MGYGNYFLTGPNKFTTYNSLFRKRNFRIAYAHSIYRKLNTLNEQPLLNKEDVFILIDGSTRKQFDHGEKE